MKFSSQQQFAFGQASGGKLLIVESTLHIRTDEALIHRGAEMEILYCAFKILNNPLRNLRENLHNMVARIELASIYSMLNGTANA